ncbi:sigma70-ECF: RNA polymerase sigma factor, sigma-70 family [Solimicrobium silvestre]|uniref:Sigma70-ECF: RNA polymerase sigma factor, sigma-70 family n=1 Tax=Solimicrobium silvestre TaxID=2099400 RepID=A0A2S9H1S2_9BURK|nr:sigma70-ECF: RNA polymerase sigma factor, sigma-70 family [Solimicrobium silvestre]
MHTSEVAALWHDWHENKGREVRDRIIEHYLPFTRMMAAKLYSKRHSEEFEFDDYLQFATIGLMESIDRYESNSLAQFTTYAAKRINGAVLDGVEQLSERQQQISTHQRRLKERSKLAGDALKTGTGTLFDQLAEIAVGLALGHLLDDTRLYFDDETIEPYNQYRGVELRQLQNRLQILVEQLPERERLLIKYTYFNHMTFDAVAQQWGLTRSRIAQLHRSALDRLRKSALDLKQYDITC